MKFAIENLKFIKCLLVALLFELNDRAHGVYGFDIDLKRDMEGRLDVCDRNRDFFVDIFEVQAFALSTEEGGGGVQRVFWWVDGLDALLDLGLLC